MTTNSRGPKLPLSTQFELAYAASSVNNYRRVKAILEPYGYPTSTADQKEFLVKSLTFTADQLLEYSQEHLDLCKQLFTDSGDKRSSPNTFMSMNKNGQYIVGLYDKGMQDTQTFDTLAEAITDYVLFSLGLQRLK